MLGSPSVQEMPGALIEQATYKNNAESLTGQTIVIEGLSALQTDVLLLIQLQDGTQHSAILRPGSPEFTIPLQASKLEVAGRLLAHGHDPYPGRGRITCCSCWRCC